MTDIIHKVLYKEDEEGNYHGMFYTCNEAIGIKEGNTKVTMYWDRVTCKNCLKQFVKKQGERKMKEYYEGMFGSLKHNILCMLSQIEGNIEYYLY